MAGTDLRTKDQTFHRLTTLKLSSYTRFANRVADRLLRESSFRRLGTGPARCGGVQVLLKCRGFWTS